MCKLFEIEPEEEAKFFTMLQDLVNQNLLYAHIVKEENEEDYQIRFLTLFEVPQKRKKVFELTFTITIFVVLLILCLIHEIFIISIIFSKYIPYKLFFQKQFCVNIFENCLGGDILDYEY